MKGNFPSNCIIVGSPAKTTRTYTNWDGVDGISYDSYITKQKTLPHYAVLGYYEQLTPISYEIVSLSYSPTELSLKEKACTSVLFHANPSTTYVLHTNGLHSQCYAIGFQADSRTDTSSNDLNLSFSAECLIPSSYLGYQNNYNLSLQTTTYNCSKSSTSSPSCNVFSKLYI